jgi:hypothetical protein
MGLDMPLIPSEKEGRGTKSRKIHPPPKESSIT